VRPAVFEVDAKVAGKIVAIDELSPVGHAVHGSSDISSMNADEDGSGGPAPGTAVSSIHDGGICCFEGF